MISPRKDVLVLSDLTADAVTPGLGWPAVAADPTLSDVAEVIAACATAAIEVSTVIGRGALAGDLAAGGECAPLRRSIRPIESDILHLGPPSRSDWSPESVSGEEALLHDIP